MFLCLLPSTHPHGCVSTAQKLSINDKEVTEGARRVCPAGLPWPREQHHKARSWFLKPGLPGNIYVILILFCLFIAPSHSSGFVAISGFEAQLGPEVLFQTLLLFPFPSYIRIKLLLCRWRRGIFEAVPCSSRVWRLKGTSFSAAPLVAGWQGQM